MSLYRAQAQLATKSPMVTRWTCLPGLDRRFAGKETHQLSSSSSECIRGLVIVALGNPEDKP